MERLGDYVGGGARLPGAGTGVVKKVRDNSGRQQEPPIVPDALFTVDVYYRNSCTSISNSLAGGYGKFSAQYGKLERAYVLDAVAALESASWGRFQIMGSNYRDAGFVLVQEFVLALARTEAAHLQAFASLVSANKGLHKALEKKDWAAFAKAYNGKGYKKNDYDSKLKNAYDKFAKGASK